MTIARSKAVAGGTAMLFASAPVSPPVLVGVSWSCLVLRMVCVFFESGFWTITGRNRLVSNVARTAGALWRVFYFTPGSAHFHFACRFQYLNICQILAKTASSLGCFSL
jgi:hypothetical protein